MTVRGPKPSFPRRPAQGAGRTVDWGRDEEYVQTSKLDGAQQAVIPGFCARCDKRYGTGEWVFREGEGRLVGVNCCATERDTRPAGDPVPLGLGDLVDAEEIDGRDWVPLAQVMPSNRTKADMCMKCFQIPSSNGVCGC